MEENNTAVEHVMKKTHVDKTEFKEVVKGYDFNQGVDYSKVFESYKTMGIQSSQLHKAFELVNKMLNWKGEEGEKCKIFLGYTSNMISCGNREIIRFLCQHKLVDVICTTAGGVEEDFIKCLADSYIANFRMNDKKLREEGINRIGNMIVPNENYCKFEDWIMPQLDAMWERQTKENFNWTPSKMIDFLGEKINNPDSVYYWCHKNQIPVYCPAITDGSLGDMLFFHSYKKKGLRVDIVEHIRGINKHAMSANQTGAIILGGGVIKHHILNANLMRNGLDYSVFINTGIEYDASDAGATPNEALSWGKIQPEGEYVKVYCEASLVFPILVGETFAKKHFEEHK